MAQREIYLSTTNDIVFTITAVIFGLLLLTGGAINAILEPMPWQAIHTAFLCVTGLCCIAAAFLDVQCSQIGPAVLGMTSFLNAGQALAVLYLLRYPEKKLQLHGEMDVPSLTYLDDFGFYPIAALGMAVLAAWCEFAVKERSSVPRHVRGRTIEFVVLVGLNGSLLWALGFPTFAVSRARGDLVPAALRATVRCVSSVVCISLVYLPWARMRSASVVLVAMLIVNVVVASIPAPRMAATIVSLFSLVPLVICLIHKLFILPKGSDAVEETEEDIVVGDPEADTARMHPFGPQTYGKSAIVV
mmetsp:Transcript_2311/g.5247  ORF Transcript_2311/g.5247 Transcript_2311/m.5247 type:complete len:302 (-) Transcript_2311:1464-2369(-)